MTKYKPHSVKCYVDISDDPYTHTDYCICYQPPKSLIIIKYGTSCEIYDFKAFMDGDFSKPLNAKKFNTTDEAYDKMMKWIGKMIKKDTRGRYYNNSVGPYHFNKVIDDAVLNRLKEDIDMDKIKKAFK
ncbi:MAG: hypothetical protein IJ880_08440 [Bacilli bacterium]|nr:hypothetical protein [Bacilli bacterium]